MLGTFGYFDGLVNETLISKEVKSKNDFIAIISNIVNEVNQCKLYEYIEPFDNLSTINEMDNLLNSIHLLEQIKVVISEVKKELNNTERVLYMELTPEQRVGRSKNYQIRTI